MARRIRLAPQGCFLVLHDGDVVDSVEASTAYSARAAAVRALGLVWSNLAKNGYTIQEAILVPFDPAPDANIASQTVQALQAQIDRLTLEFCPEDMTEAQKARWAAHQKPV